jgi:hypothetical protein
VPPGYHVRMAQQWTFEGAASPGQFVVAYDHAGQELARWLVQEDDAVDATVEADAEPEWRVEDQGPDIVPGSPA